MDDKEKKYFEVALNHAKEQLAELVLGDAFIVITAKHLSNKQTTSCDGPTDILEKMVKNVLNDMILDKDNIISENTKADIDNGILK